MGQSVEKCLEIVRTPDSNDVRHVLNRVSVSFVVETSILPDAFDMPAIKVGGRLPLLQLNFSDRKYRTFMNIVDLISPPEEEGEKPEGIVFRRSPNIDRVLALGLRKELLLEGPSDDTSDQDGEQDESDDDTFYDAEDRPLASSSRLSLYLTMTLLTVIERRCIIGWGAQVAATRQQDSNQAVL